jgi:hypothetical protein
MVTGLHYLRVINLQFSQDFYCGGKEDHVYVALNNMLSKPAAVLSEFLLRPCVGCSSGDYRDRADQTGFFECLGRSEAVHPTS